MPAPVKAGEAYVEIGIDQAALKSGLSRAEGQLRGFGASLATALKALAGAYVIKRAVGGIMSMTQSWADAGDEIQKMQQRTGWGTEALSRLRYAADLSGTSLETLEVGIHKMQGTISDAGRGVGTAVDLLARLGLTYQDLGRLKPEDQFMLIMERLEGVRDLTERAALAVDLYGQSGTALLPMIADGTAGLREMMNSAREVFTQEDADKAARYNDAITQLRKSFRGVVANIAPIIAGKLIPWIEKAAEKVTDLSRTWKRTGLEIASAYLQAFNKMAIVIEQWLGTSIAYIGIWALEFKKVLIVARDFWLSVWDSIAAKFQSMVGWMIEKWAVAMHSLGLMSDEKFAEIWNKLSEKPAAKNRGDATDDELNKIDARINRIRKNLPKAIGGIKGPWADTIATLEAMISRENRKLAGAAAGVSTQPVPVLQRTLPALANQFQSLGTVGMWGGANIGEQMGVLGRGRDVQSEQLSEQKKMNEKLGNIEENTARTTVPVWG